MPAGRSLRSRDTSKSSRMDESCDSVDYAQADVMEEDDTATASAYLTRVGVKRKPGDSQITIHNTPKKRRRIRSGDEESFPHQDVYCWECHKECIEGDLNCAACPRTYHVTCLPEQIDATPEWTCPVCLSIAKAECETTRSWATRLLSPDQLAVLLCFTLRRMRHSDSEPFQHPVPQTLVQDYYEIVFCPMDLATLEKKVRKGCYASTEGFIADANWILHNSFIFNGWNSKYTNDAKLIMKICKFEISELELCPDCYRNSVIRQENWFSEPCTSPHCLVWAKLKGFPIWPAKCLRMSANNQMVDVRFFGEYDRAWIPIAQASLLTEEYPVAKKNLKKYGLDKAIEELHDHIDRLREKFGGFKYSQSKVDFNPEFLTSCPQFEGDPKTMALRSTPHCRPMAAPSPSLSSVAASDLRDNDLEPCHSTYGPSASPQHSDDVAGVFTSDQSLQGSLDNPDALDANKPADSIGEDNLSCLERIKNCLQQENVERKAESPVNTMASSVVAPTAVKSVSSPSLERRAKKTLKNVTATLSDSPGMRNDSPIVDPVTPTVKKTPYSQPEIIDAAKIKDVSTSAISSPILPPTYASTPIMAVTQQNNNNSKLRPILPKIAQEETCKEIESFCDATASPPVVKPMKPSTSVEPSNNNESDSNIAAVFEKHAEKVTTFLQSTFESMWDELSNSIRRKNDTVVEGATQPDSNNNAELQKLRNQLARLQWMSQTSIEEVKKNTKLALTEMRKRLESEKMKSLSDLMKKGEAEKVKAVQEAKSKQWCANCGKEAVFYCCWNTSYCDYPCQQHHWPKHQQTCAQIRHGQPPLQPARPPGPQPIIGVTNQNPVFYGDSPVRLQSQLTPNFNNLMVGNKNGPPPNVSLRRV